MKDTTDSTVAIMNAMGFTYCFVALCLLIGVCIITAVVQRSIRHSSMLAHQEALEKLRLANTKEITVRDGR